MNLYLQVYTSLLGEVIRRIYLLTASTRRTEDDWEPPPCPLQVEGECQIALHPLFLANMQAYQFCHKFFIRGIRHIEIFRLQWYLSRFLQGFLPESLKVLRHWSKCFYLFWLIGHLYQILICLATSPKLILTSQETWFLHRTQLQQSLSAHKGYGVIMFWQKHLRSNLIIYSGAFQRNTSLTSHHMQGSRLSQAISAVSMIWCSNSLYKSLSGIAILLTEALCYRYCPA